MTTTKLMLQAMMELRGKVYKERVKEMVDQLTNLTGSNLDDETRLKIEGSVSRDLDKHVDVYLRTQSSPRVKIDGKEFRDPREPQPKMSQDDIERDEEPDLPGTPFRRQP